MGKFGRWPLVIFVASGGKKSVKGQDVWVLMIQTFKTFKCEQMGKTLRRTRPG